MRYLISLLILSLVCWGLTLPADALQQGFMFWRNQGIQLTGILAIALMGALMLMALRPHWLEQRLGGLDHLYQLHKWSGITAGSMVLLHWLLTKSPRWLVEAGLLDLGARAPHVPGADALRGVAKEAGEYCFYALILFLIISLVKILPYGRFRQIHKVGAILFLLAAFHSIYLLPDVTRWAPFGLLTLAAGGLGSLAALWSLFGQSGRLQRYQGNIMALRQHAGNVLELEVALPTDFHDEYLPGQFALLTLHQEEGAHPFTIVREDIQNGSIIFAIKALGDYTRQLAQQVQVGDTVTVEGPYGRFVLPPSGSQQYWIAGGIGITPFMAWLEGLVAEDERRPGAHLYYCVNSQQEILFAERLQQLSKLTGVKVTIIDRQIDGFLDASRLDVDEDTQLWFCGPKGMRDMLLTHVPSSQLHYEQFEFR
ncbi:ferredoxin reductase family protein [Tolumonas lignilytica]|uniref:ferredoxin reductase family protein n=1 Tax=Tolumonas lignilytica TaxID=1283284 RepID=UPI0004666446|nr:ferric reductase-like transmembrane domain-containing protein [Tolumonas lignilytica]